MKTACIFTFHNVPNYGAILQAYALSHYIENVIGCHVDVMDFQCKGNGSEFIPEEYIKSICRSKKKITALYKKIMTSLYFKQEYVVKFDRFQQFKKDKLSEVSYDRTYEYDAVILGSDQIWNPDITGGFQPEFFGQSDLVKSSIRISYAASCGDVSKQTEAQRNEMIQYVKGLDYVGVREKSLSDYLAANGIKNMCTLDPTFLLSSDEYDELLTSQMNKESSYLLVYELQKSEILEQTAFEIAKEKNLDVLVLAGYSSYAKKASYEIRNAGPIEFLSYVKNADYILTNSFHGTAFSLIYRKDFNVILPQTRTSRIVDLLKTVGLENRIISKGNLHSEQIDYESNENGLRKLVASSQEYLRETLGGEKVE